MKGLDGLLPKAALFFSCLFPCHVAAISILYPPANINQPGLQHLNESNSYSPASDFITLSAPIDPLFGFVPTFRGPKLDENSALLNSVDAALQLALEEFDALLGETIYVLESHPEVQITIVPSESEIYRKIPRRFAVWGLNIGIDLMIRTRNFQSAVFLLTHEGRGIATIEYSVIKGRSSPATDSSDAVYIVAIQDNSTIPFNRTKGLEENITNNNASTIKTFASRRSPNLRVGFHLSGRVLTKYDICYAALDALRGLADYRRTALISDSITPLLAADLEVITVDANVPPRTSRNPPYFQAQWLMRALAEMPGYMLGLGIFMETSIEISVDKTLVGWVLLRRNVLLNVLK